MEKSNEDNIHYAYLLTYLWIGFIIYEKVFDIIEHFAIFEDLRRINRDETHVKIWQKHLQSSSSMDPVNLVMKIPYRQRSHARRCNFT